MFKLKKGMTPTFSPDGSLLATSGSSDVLLYSTADGALQKQFKVLPNVSHAAFSPQGDRMAIKNTTGRIAVYDLDGKLLLDCKNQREGEGCGLIWSLDGAQLIDGSWSGRIYRRDASTGQILAEGLCQKVDSVTLLPDGRLASTQLTRGEKPQKHLEFRDAQTLDFPKEKLMFGGYRLKSGVSGYGEFAWAIRNQPQGIHFDLHDLGLGLVSTLELSSHGFGVAVAFAPGNKEMTIAAEPDAIVRLSLPQLQQKAKYEIKSPGDACYAPDGNRLALGGWTSGLLVDVC